MKTLELVKIETEMMYEKEELNFFAKIKGCTFLERNVFEGSLLFHEHVNNVNICQCNYFYEH